MIRLCAGAVLGVLLYPLPGPAQPAASPGPSAAITATRNGLKDLAADLREARELARTIADRRARDRLEVLLSRAERNTADLQRNVAALAAPALPQAITQDDLDGLLKGLKAEAFDNTKVPFISNIAKTRHFTCAQARQLLKSFVFDEGRVQAAVILYPRIIDQGNFFMVLDAFTFDSNRRAVREKLKLD